MSVDVAALLHELNIHVTEGSSSTSWLLRAADDASFEVEPGVAAQRLTAHRVGSTVRVATPFSPDCFTSANKQQRVSSSAQKPGRSTSSLPSRYGSFT